MTVGVEYSIGAHYSSGGRRGPTHSPVVGTPFPGVRVLRAWLPVWRRSDWTTPPARPGPVRRWRSLVSGCLLRPGAPTAPGTSGPAPRHSGGGLDRRRSLKRAPKHKRLVGGRTGRTGPYTHLGGARRRRVTFGTRWEKASHPPWAPKRGDWSSHWERQSLEE